MSTHIPLQFPKAFLFSLAELMADDVHASRVQRDLAATSISPYDLWGEKIRISWRPMLRSMDSLTRRSFVDTVRYHFFRERREKGTEFTTRQHVAAVISIKAQQHYTKENKVAGDGWRVHFAASTFFCAQAPRGLEMASNSFQQICLFL